MTNAEAKQYIINKTAKDLNLPPEVIEVVIMNQFKQANKAVKANDEVEISGFGKFLMSQNKLKNRGVRVTDMIQRLEIRLQNAATPEDVMNTTSKLERCKEALQFYNSKIKPEDEFKRDNRRVAQSSFSPSKAQGAYTQGEQGEVRDMQEVRT